ncbi:hypothetical protein HMPREF0491_00670 [Lachnospiraceae oral taxon 107 str. F0167]|jgi:PTS system, lactose/cellobiose family IIC component|uniref:PTS sugar transporter subunit IIC n=1 Tax=Lachnoanaerobaculum sp. Marseille-Q4761 TaxID=2819511 RepID=UPI0002083723|nr:PTS transporter subunit EIIC [Lachnoanaerobaculum sp. Marseille-Q4761]EGG89540.1 hypothetical protein HMPREF0491_00670 [Lachnospiraceae oral taxon 107 str. F0167]MBO1871723.1 PTS sugar transporter subunit IIC [Lachnoanaerobaculum sp. Marseille-Q4761]RKW58810.1 MAG: PTS sugar transporter subunit IIC [Lachnospiraceae bacterium]
MFDKMATFLDKNLSTPMAKLSEQRHLRAVRDGIIATLPIVIVSSLFLVIAFLPNQMPASWGIAQFIKANVGRILLPYRMAMYIMTLYAVFGIGFSLAKSYDLDGLSGAILSELAFLLTVVPVSLPEASEEIKNLAASNQALADYLKAIPSGWHLGMSYIGSDGMFVGILTAFFAVEIYRFTQKSGFKIRMPEQVPASVARSFEALTPTVIILLIVSTICMWLGINVHGIVGAVIRPIVHVADTLPSVLFLTFLDSFFWCFGIHGSSVVGSVTRPIWLVLLEQNSNALAAGVPIPNIAPEAFYQWFIFIGGSGTTIGLAILLLFKSKSQYGKTLGKVAFVPALFNINEPMIFGCPIILNPVLLIPFVLTPTICAIIGWIATELGLVNRVVASAPWTLPGPIGAFLATNGDIRAFILNVLLIILSVIIYLPFFNKYDADLKKQEDSDIAA